MTKKSKLNKQTKIVTVVKNIYIAKIISCGQPGVELAALKSAAKNSIPHGGYIPKDYRTYSGSFSELKKYNVKPISSTLYEKAINLCIKEADLILVIKNKNRDKNWLDYVIEQTYANNRLLLMYNIEDIDNIYNNFHFNLPYMVQNVLGRKKYLEITTKGIKVYVTGPREHKSPDIQAFVGKKFNKLFDKINSAT